MICIHVLLVFLFLCGALFSRRASCKENRVTVFHSSKGTSLKTSLHVDNPRIARGDQLLYRGEGSSEIRCMDEHYNIPSPRPEMYL